MSLETEIPKSFWREITELIQKIKENMEHDEVKLNRGNLRP